MAATFKHDETLNLELSIIQVHYKNKFNIFLDLKKMFSDVKLFIFGNMQLTTIYSNKPHYF